MLLRHRKDRFICQFGAPALNRVCRLRTLRSAISAVSSTEKVLLFRRRTSNGDEASGYYPSWPTSSRVFLRAGRTETPYFPSYRRSPYKPCNNLEWLVVNGYIHYHWIPEKGYHGVVVLKPFEERIGIMTWLPIRGAQTEEAGVYSLCPGLGSDLTI